MSLSFQLECGELQMALIKDVEDVETFLKSVLTGEIECGLVKANLLLDPFQLVVAANRALISKSRSSLVTKSIYTETLYNLSTSKNISQSLVKFGASKNDSHVVVFVFGEPHQLDEILTQIKGTQVSFDQLKEISDSKEIKKVYSVQDSELKVSSLLDSVVTKISTKTCII